MDTPGHEAGCICNECLKHVFLERVHSDVCHICLKPRNHPHHISEEERDRLLKMWKNQSEHKWTA